MHFALNLFLMFISFFSARLLLVLLLFLYVYFSSLSSSPLVYFLTLQVLRLVSSKPQGGNTFKSCHVGIHWNALVWYSKNEYPRATVSVTFLKGFLYLFVLAKLATSSERVNLFLFFKTFFYFPWRQVKLAHIHEKTVLHDCIYKVIYGYNVTK